MSIINLKPEAVELLNQLCDPGNIEDTVMVLDSAEQQLQELAFGETNPVNGNSLFSLAFQVKSYKKDLMKLKALLQDGNDS